jgi:hypothetical protein
MKYLLILFTAPFYGQILHHQMFSSQGSTKLLSNGLVIKQTIGQQSLIGNSDNNYIVMQGFQQSVWGKYISSNLIDEIKTVTYPNPFIQTISFEFSKPITEVISVTVFDIGGHLIFEQKKKSNNNILTIDLPSLARSEYLVRLNTSNFNYYTKIIKL